MNRPRPNRSNAVAVTLLVTVAIAGCRGQQTAMTNPFLSPDRVPPPATRMVPPGTAEPYYPGDQLSAPQSATEPTAPVDSFVEVESAPSNQSPAATFLAGDDAPIAIPGDNDDLRFALPTPPPVAEVTPPAPAPTVVAAQGPSYSQPPPAPAVMSAVFNEADAYQVTAAESAVADSGPWRPPQIPGSSATPSFAQNSQPTAPQPLVAQPMMAPQPAFAAAPQPALASLPPPPIAPAPLQTAPQPAMPVQLRAVPSPPLEIATSAAPRIRFADPAAAVVQPGAVPSGSVSQATYTASTPGVPYWLGAPPSVAAAPQTGTPASPDGFRPRGSTW